VSTTDYTARVIAYLLAQATASTSLGGLAPDPVTIIDGQPATADVLVANPDGLTQRLWIGGPGDVLGRLADAAGSDQGFAFLDQARTRDNQIDVQCAAEAISGDTVMANARNGAYAVMAAVELMLRGSLNTSPASPGDSSMGGLVRWSEVTGPIELSQGQIDQGALALLKFRVSAFVRLTS
jgi:hypothetical protein